MQVENKLCQDTANTSVASLQLSYSLTSECYCFCVSPFLPVILNLLHLLCWCPPVLGENKAKDWTRHLYSDALMESLRLKWQEVKGESTENSREPHTATLLSLCQTTQLWWYGKCVCLCVCFSVQVYVCMRRRKGRRMSERFHVCGWLWRTLRNSSFCSQAFFFC